MLQDPTEDVAHKDTPTSTWNSIKELLRELHKKKVQSNIHSSQRYGPSSFAHPHTNPTPDMSHSSNGTLPLRPEYKIPSVPVTKVHHHHHYVPLQYTQHLPPSESPIKILPMVPIALSQEMMKVSTSF